SGRPEGPVAVAAVEDLAPQQPNRLGQPAFADVFRQLLQLLPLHEGEQVRRFVKLQVHHLPPFLPLPLPFFDAPSGGRNRSFSAQPRAWARRRATATVGPRWPCSSLVTVK